MFEPTFTPTRTPRPVDRNPQAFCDICNKYRPDGLVSLRCADPRNPDSLIAVCDICVERADIERDESYDDLDD
jgi:hypothetical protein